MAREPSISETMRASFSRNLAAPGYSSKESRTKPNVKAAISKGEAIGDEVYGDTSSSGVANRAGWMASIADVFSGVLFGKDEEDTATPSSTYDEDPILASTIRQTSDNIIEPSRRDDVALTGDFDYNAIQDVPAMLDEGFTAAAEQVAANMSLPVHWLYAVIDTESGFDPQVRNEEYVRQGREEDAAIGSIQFMPDTAEELGTSVEELRNMSLTEQLTYVERYYERYADKINSPEDMYVATLYPAALGRDDDFVLGSQAENPSRSIAAVYNGQPSMDTNNDNQITLREVKEWYRNSRGYNRFIQPFQMPSN